MLSYVVLPPLPIHSSSLCSFFLASIQGLQEINVCSLLCVSLLESRRQAGYPLPHSYKVVLFGLCLSPTKNKNEMCGIPAAESTTDVGYCIIFPAQTSTIIRKTRIKESTRLCTGFKVPKDSVMQHMRAT